jgi:Cdc6-like AAA superfamily ATPase
VVWWFGMAEDPIFRFKEVLTPNYTPDHLPHREKELKTISSLINVSVQRLAGVKVIHSKS